jgi:hypothetical protein
MADKQGCSTAITWKSKLVKRERTENQLDSEINSGMYEPNSSLLIGTVGPWNSRKVGIVEQWHSGAIGLAQSRMQGFRY